MTNRKLEIKKILIVIMSIGLSLNVILIGEASASDNVQPSIQPTATSVTISGDITFMDDDDYINAPTIEKPLPCVFVQIWLLGTWGGTPAWVAIEDSQADDKGHYSIECNLILPCEIKVYVWANIPDVVIVRPSLDLAYYYETDGITIATGNTNQIVDILFDPNLQDELKWTNIVATIYDVFIWIKDNTGTVVPGGVQRNDFIDIIYPDDTEQVSFYRPILDNIYLRSDDWLNDNTIQHEYGHAIMNTLGSGISSISAPQTHNVFTEISETFSYSEGWAEFISCCVDNNATNLFYGLDSSGDFQYYNTIEQNHWEKYEENPELTNEASFDGEYVEGSVASILWDIYDDSTAIDVRERIANSPSKCYSDGIDVINDDDLSITPDIIEPTFDDGLQMGIDEIFDVITNTKPDNILNFWDGWFSTIGNTAVQRNTPENLHWMKAIYYNHGVLRSDYTETAPAPNLNMEILTSSSGAYNGAISLCANYVTDLDSEDISFLRCRFEYYEDLNGNGEPDDGKKWELISESTNSDYLRTASWDTGSVLEGTYLLRAIVDDDMKETYKNYSNNPIIIDHRLPLSNVLSGAYWHNTILLPITVTASDLNGIKNVALKYKYRATDANVWGSEQTFGTDTASPWSWSFTWPKGEGHYQFYSIATDNAGNIEAVPTTPDAEFGYDKVAPPVPPLVSPINGASSTNHLPTFDWNPSVDSLSGVQYYKFQVDDESGFQTLLINIQIPSTTTQYVLTSALSDGLWYWRVLPVDKAGNVGPSNAWSIDLWTPPPPPQTGNVGGIVRTSVGLPLAGATITAVGASPAVKPGTGETIFSSGDENTVNTVITISGTDGSWSMSIASCTATFTATKSGYYSDTAVTNVPSGGWTTIYLSLTAIPTDPVYNTGGGGGGCLLSGTRIDTPEGSVKIEDINEGDIVLSFDEWTGTIESRMVYQTTVHTNFEGYMAVNNRLMITANHLIYTERGLVAAGNLIVGDVMMTLSGTESVTSIEMVPELVTVYNFDVEDNHNYFADGILVHNVVTLKDGCPFIYAWNGSNYVEENNILPQSTKPDRNHLDVDDCYMLQNEMMPMNGSYSVQLYEPALERTHLDSVRLAIIDYDDSNTMPMLTPDGTLVSITDLQAATSCIDGTGSEVLELVDEMNDGYTLKAEHNETLTVYFPDMFEFTEAKLVISHKAIIDILPYDVPLDPRYYKCSIHVQTMNGDGEWYDIASIPARMNKALDAVDITSLKASIQNDMPIRLLITGTHIIDFIGIDFSDSADFNIEYVLPSYASYYNCTLSQNLTELLVQKDQRYAILNPKECIDISFPYKEQLKEHRALAFLSNGHYNTLSEIDIEQPVAIKATIKSGTDGTVSLFVCEMVNRDNARDMVGITSHVSNWPNNETVLGFVQDSREEYRLSARFDGCTEETVIEVEIISARGSRTCYLRYSPEMGPSAKVDCQLKDILWNVTGVSFNEYSNHYSVLKGTPLQFDINDWYGYNTQSWSGYTWCFGDGECSEDLRPIHEFGEIGTCLINLTVQNAGPGMLFYAETRIDVVISPPTPIFEIYQDVILDLTVAGRKDNSVGIRIYEDGLLIQSYDVVRTAGLPNSITIELNKYLDRIYEIELVYNAEHKGSNPTWLNFTFGDTNLTFFKEFNTKCGFCQTISVPSAYLVDVVANEFKYCFDASGSYDLDGEIASYAWDFGDGSASEGMLVEHSFIEPGLYTVILTITDDDGAIAREIREVEVC